MASVPNPTSSVRDTILSDGYFVCQDAAIGQRLEELDQPFGSPLGLQFCNENVLKNPVSLHM